MDVKINLPMQVQYILNTLNNKGYEAYVVGGCVRDSLLGVNPKTDLSGYDMPVFAGNVKEGKNIYDYTKIESFATENAYLTAEGAISLAVQKSEKSLINAAAQFLARQIEG